VSSDRIRAGLIAFCAGDALGVPWEGRPPGEVDAAAPLAQAPARDGWPRGATSDDSAQTLLVAREIVRSHGDPDPQRFLDALADALPSMRGAGRTTRAAVERWRSDGTPTAPEGDGATNGAAMRALPIGWSTAPTAVEERRAMTETLTRTTHGDGRALAAARAIAAMASYATAGAPLFSVMAAGIEEAGAYGAGDLTSAAIGAWSPPADGVPFESLPTVAAVIEALRKGKGSPGRVMRVAVALGGDTDTVAALAGGIAASRSGSLDGVDWLDDVVLPAGEAELDSLADDLSALRG
jgi:ADP-ribosyl-[dinitrogen reductase] hydrolase